MERRTKTRLTSAAMIVAAVGLLNVSPAPRAQPPMPPGMAPFHGKPVTVRFYTDRNAPDQYRHEILKVNLATLPIDSSVWPAGTAVVVHPADQGDPAVTSALAGRIETWIVGKQRQIQLQTFPGPRPPRPVFTIVDAAGFPIPAAAVTLILQARSDGWTIRIPAGTTDEDGVIALPWVHGVVRMDELRVSRSEYGTAEVNTFPDPTTNKLYTPLVKAGELFHERALRGVVVDPDGRPVAGAAVSVRQLFIPESGTVMPKSLGAYRALTDAEGRFAYYLPTNLIGGPRGDLIPPRAVYGVRVETPDHPEFAAYLGNHQNTQEACIRLVRGGRRHTFVFLDGNGRPLEPYKSGHIGLYRIGARGQRYPLEDSDWLKGGSLEPGTYGAFILKLGTQTTHLEFPPIVVDEKSPEELVFRLPAGRTFHGRVVDGSTSLPVAGAFVVGVQSHRSGGDRLRDFTPKQWAALQALPERPAPTDPALQCIHERYGVDCLVRTNAQGEFLVNRPPHESFYSFTVLSRGFLPVERRMYEKEIGDRSPAEVAAVRTDAADPAEEKTSRRHSIKGLVEVPGIPLFPAGRVRLRIEPEEAATAVSARWVIDMERNPPWVGWFDDDKRPRDIHILPEYGQTFRPEDPWIWAPAGVRLHLNLAPHHNSRWSGKAIPQEIYLGQGQTFDLGSITLERAVEIVVRVLDSRGEPVEGVPISWCVGGQWRLGDTSDIRGSVHLYVDAFSKGKVGVLKYLMRERRRVEETVPFEIGGPEDAGRVFEVVVSDETLKAVFDDMRLRD